MVSCSKFWGNLGEIPQFGWKIPGVYRVKEEIMVPILAFAFNMGHY